MYFPILTPRTKHLEPLSILNKMKLNFIKMNGAGNDFVIIDRREEEKTEEELVLTPAQAKKITSRNNLDTGGCDQLIIIRPAMEVQNTERFSATAEYPDVMMDIYNADGNKVTACGNATRCIAWLIMQETKKDKVIVQTWSRRLACYNAGDKKVRVDMGEPIFEPKLIPIAKNIEPKNITISYGTLKNGVAVGMGNPHVIFFVDDANTPDLEKYGATIEQQHLDVFPARVNVNAAQIINRSKIKLRVWERGVGITLACGTGACATLVAAAEQNLTERKADVEMQGGTLTIEWGGDNHVWMTGAVETEFTGEIEID